MATFGERRKAKTISNTETPLLQIIQPPKQLVSIAGFPVNWRRVQEDRADLATSVAPMQASF